MNTIDENMQRIRHILDELYFNDDVDQGEMLNAELAIIEGEIKESLKFFVDLAYQQKLETEKLESIADMAAKKLKQSIGQLDRTNEFIKSIMLANDIKKIRGTYTSKGIQKGRFSTFVPVGFDARKLEERFKTHYPERWEVKKTAVKNAINNNEKVPGLSLVRGKEIMVER